MRFNAIRSVLKMPKKFVGMNSKASEAKARRDAIKQEVDAKKKKEIEDELWRDDDKSVVKKQKRKASFIDKSKKMADVHTILLMA